jgi:hypothetical protein
MFDMLCFFYDKVMEISVFLLSQIQANVQSKMILMMKVGKCFRILFLTILK